MTGTPWERPVADAEIIPIGTRGRPGRGTGSPKPSSAARSLAAKPAPKAAASKPRTATPRRTSKAASAETIEQVSTEAVPPAAPPSAPPRPAATTADRGPLAAIAPDAWLSMLQGAAREVWGEQWEP